MARFALSALRSAFGCYKKADVAADVVEEPHKCLNVRDVDARVPSLVTVAHVSSRRTRAVIAHQLKHILDDQYGSILYPPTELLTRIRE